MRAEEILKECEEDRLCGFEEFDRNEIIMMMNMYAKEAFNAAREKKNQIITMNGTQYESYYLPKIPKYDKFDEWLKNTKEIKRVFNELDPYGEENWDDNDKVNDKWNENLNEVTFFTDSDTNVVINI